MAIEQSITSIEVIIRVNDNDAGIITIETPPPWTKKKKHELGVMLGDMMETQLAKIEACYAEVAKHCDCFSKDRPANHPLKAMHGSECAIHEKVPG